MKIVVFNFLKGMYFMSNNRKVLGAIVGAMVGTFGVNANAQNIVGRGMQSGNGSSCSSDGCKTKYEITSGLFKIHDISPLKNNEGAVVACNLVPLFIIVLTKILMVQP